MTDLFTAFEKIFTPEEKIAFINLYRAPINSEKKNCDYFKNNQRKLQRIEENAKKKVLKCYEDNPQHDAIYKYVKKQIVGEHSIAFGILFRRIEKQMKQLFLNTSTSVENPTGPRTL